MRYTTLAIDERGVVLLAGHRARLAPEGAGAVAALETFARTAAPGVYAITADGERLSFRRREGSLLHDGIPVRLAVSPYAHAAGPFPKPASPSRYDAVRVPGVATLLSSAGGDEILESCTAAVIGWSGSAFVCVPAERPRVASVAEAALRRELPFVERPLAVRGAEPLLLLNAVKGPCRVTLAGRPPFPDAAVEALSRMMHRLTERP